MNLVEGIDYCFIYPKGEETSVHIRFLQGPYRDTIFQYGKVKFEERGDVAYLLFNYSVIDSTTSTPDKLEKDEDFKNYIGDMLVEIMSQNIEEEIIDETRIDHSEISDL